VQTLVSNFESKMNVTDTSEPAAPSKPIARSASGFISDEEEDLKGPSESSVPFHSTVEHTVSIPSSKSMEQDVSSDEEDDDEEQQVADLSEKPKASKNMAPHLSAPNYNAYLPEDKRQKPVMVGQQKSERTMYKYDRSSVVNQLNFSEEMNSFVLPFHEKSEETIEILSQALRQNYIFSQISYEQEEQIIGAMQQEDYGAGKIIITQGEVGDYFYAVETGKVCVVFQGNAFIYSEAFSFGEWSLIHDIPRTATCVAATDCRLWKIDKKSFRYCLAKQIIEDEHHVLEILRKVPILRSLDDTQLVKLLDCMFTKKYSKGEKIINKGDIGDSFHIVKSGEVHIHNIGRGSSTFVDHQLGAGEYFGERALLTGEPRAANVTALTECLVYGIDRVSFEKVVGKLEQIMERDTIFNSVPIFANTTLTDVEKLRLGRKLKTKTYSKGEILLQPGKPVLQCLHIIKKGQILIINGKGELIRLEAGDYFGGNSITKDPTELTDKTITAEEDTECKVLSRSDIINIVEDVARLGNPIPEVPYVKNLQFKLKDIRQHKLLGEGGFGKVWLATTKGHPEPFALKVLSKKQLKEAGQIDFVLREKNIMNGINHPFVMGMIGCSQDKHSLYFVLPLFSGGELYELIHPEGVPKKDHGLPLENVVFYSACLLDALQYLHKRGIAHRDMKPENVLIGSDGYCTIVDFGFAKVAYEKTFTMCGTFEYMAPEIITAKGYNFAVDCWAFAVIVFEMLVGKTPFFSKQKMKLFKKILVVNFKPEHIENEDARDLVTKILVHKPTSRLGNQADGVCDILDHPFFNSINWKKLKNKEMEPPWKPEPKEAVDLPEGSFLKEDCNGETESSEVDDELFEDFSEHG